MNLDNIDLKKWIVRLVVLLVLLLTLHAASLFWRLKQNEKPGAEAEPSTHLVEEKLGPILT